MVLVLLVYVYSLMFLLEKRDKSYEKIYDNNSGKEIFIFVNGDMDCLFVFRFRRGNKSQKQNSKRKFLHNQGTHTYHC